MIEIENPRHREQQIKEQIAEIQSRQKSADRKPRIARLIRWGIIIEATEWNGRPTEERQLERSKRSYAKTPTNQTRGPETEMWCRAWKAETNM